MERKKFRSAVRESLSDTEQRIAVLESALGIHTKFDRLLEASLFIDSRYFDSALIMGKIDGVERIFGHEEWAGYLDARLYAREHGNRPLTTDHILELHRRMGQKTNPDMAGKLGDSKLSRGGKFINGEFLPITCTDRQIAAIDGNPFLSFNRADPNSNNGFIEYKILRKEEKKRELDNLCDWYNTERSNQEHDPLEVAARLEHRLASIHALPPFSGRMARLLMNQSLENDGQNPSSLANFDEDLFTDEKYWKNSVYAGCVRYGIYKKRKILALENDNETLTEIFLSFPYNKFYNEFYKIHYTTPPNLQPGIYHAESTYDRFVSSVVNQWLSTRAQIGHKPYAILESEF